MRWQADLLLADEGGLRSSGPEVVELLRAEGVMPDEDRGLSLGRKEADERCASEAEDGGQVVVQGWPVCSYR